jgi:hypothetical protein
MKKTILLSAIFAMFLTNCSDDEGDIDSYGPNATIVGFSAEETSSTFGTNLDESTLIVPVDLISYANETLPTSDVTIQWSVNEELSTAEAGVDFDMPANTTVVIPAGSTVATFPITVHPSVFDPFAPKVLVLDLTSASNAIVGAQYSQVAITLQGVCVSELAGEYSTFTTRVENGNTYSWDSETISLLEGSTYTTENIGGYHGASGTPGVVVVAATGDILATTPLPAAPVALLTFTEVCGKIKVDTQNLANAYTNEVRQSPAQYDMSMVDDETGVITIAYSIFFTDNTIERPFISVYTPIN